MYIFSQVLFICTLVPKVFGNINKMCGLARHLIGIKVVPIQNVLVAKKSHFGQLDETCL